MYRALTGQVCLHTMGGLGNQLFQLAAGLTWSASVGANLVIDGALHSGRGSRPFQVGELIKRHEDVVVIEPRSRIQQLLSKVSKHEVCSFEEGPENPAHRLVKLGSGNCARGYFQDLEIVMPSLEMVRSIVANKMGGAALDYGFGLHDIVIHVRRGDYELKRNAPLGILGYEFYVNSINRLESLGFTGRIHVVSEKSLPMEPWIQEFGSRIVQAPPGDVWSHLALLSSAPGLVLANSSLSWWGGALNPQRAIVIPEPWFVEPSLSPTNLALNHWLVEGSKW